MKKVLWLGIIFSFIFLGNHTVAVGQTTPTSFNYTFNASAVGSTVKVTVGGATGSKSTYQLLIQTTPLPTTPPSQGIFNNTQTPNSKGVMTWSVPETANVTYYVAVVEIPSNTYTLPAYVGSPQTVQTSVVVAFNPLVIAPAPAFDPGFILVQGKINTAKEPHYATYKIYLTYSQNADLSNPINTEWQSFIDNHLDNKQGISTGTDTNGDTDPNGPGSYYWLLPKLTPGATYYLQQKIIVDTDHILYDAIRPFNGGSGATTPSTSAFTPSGSPTSSTNLNKTTYTLLSGGFPGLSSVPSAEVCASQQAAATAAGKNVPLCSINDLINYAVKLLIGLCAIVLVLRLMFEGYQYMVTDVPFLKASAKAGFVTALMGLLLALTSYIILNTINPKLVSENINISPLTIGVAGSDGFGVTNAVSGTGGSGSNKTGGPITLSLAGGATDTIAPCDTSQMQSVTAFGHTFTIQKNLVASIQRINTKWQQMSPQYPITTVGGYKCRTIANSSSTSYHAYGLAVDINEDANPPNYTGNKGNMNAAFIKLWTDEGWGWGGSWKSFTDPMHFSKGKNEYGNLSGQ
jgi:hypothetical protein